MVRLFKADIHGVMDQLEDKGLLLKQHLRDMEKVLGQKEARLKKMAVSRSRVEQECERYKQETEKLEQDIEVAIKRGKDDMARMLITRSGSMAGHRDELGRLLERQDREIARFRDCVEKQRLQYEQIKHRSAEYFHKAEQQEWEETMSAIIPSGIYQELRSEEIELELLQRKEAIKGGERS